MPMPDKDTVFKYLLPVRLAGSIAGGLARAVGTILATFIMICVITGCIVGSVLVVYVLDSIGAEEEISLTQARLGYTSIIYYTDKETGEHIPLQRLYRPDHNRIWVDLEDIPQHTVNAMIAIEDKRFWSHEGVDWWRTSGAFINLLVPISGTTAGGGSTNHLEGGLGESGGGVGGGGWRR
ncbi:MAG: transglycosylase domain-containing protein, partial [Oscillospiraceae bacterium]|nr:transglycosylase domain-containing protein [Oscillospiraceae bacterium]